MYQEDQKNCFIEEYRCNGHFIGKAMQTLGYPRDRKTAHKFLQGHNVDYALCCKKAA